MSDALTHDDLEFLDRIALDTIEPVEPPAEVRARVMAAIRPRVLDQSIPGAHESRTVRANEGKWKTVEPGVEVRKLSVDKNRGTVTLMIRMAPNAILSAHDHEGPEDSYVIAGSCRIGAVELGTGDFHHVDAKAHHGDVVANAEGCTLLLTVDLADAA
jgi:anti-sigma factor ChrR (cupin superfamily)